MGDGEQRHGYSPLRGSGEVTYKGEGMYFSYKAVLCRRDSIIAEYDGRREAGYAGSFSDHCNERMPSLAEEFSAAELTCFLLTSCSVSGLTSDKKYKKEEAIANLVYLSETVDTSSKLSMGEKHHLNRLISKNVLKLQKQLKWYHY
jgi:hypothetical protein